MSHKNDVQKTSPVEPTISQPTRYYEDILTNLLQLWVIKIK